jgi:hypothetical protein
MAKRPAQHAVALMKGVVFADGERDVDASHQVEQTRVVSIGKKGFGVMKEMS